METLRHVILSKVGYKPASAASGMEVDDVSSILSKATSPSVGDGIELACQDVTLDLLSRKVVNMVCA